MDDSVIWASRVFFKLSSNIFFRFNSVECHTHHKVSILPSPGSYEVKHACTFSFFNSFQLPCLQTMFLIF